MPGQCRKLSFLIGLLFAVCSTHFLASKQLMAQTWQLYDDSEVAVVEIDIDPNALKWVYREENRHSDSMHVATVRFRNAYIDKTIDSVGFRLRGNTSRDADKKSFKLSFNTFKPGRQFYGVDKLNLNGEHNDPSIIRSKLCWDFFETIGLHASSAAHAAVYINDAYYGLYISVEHIDDEFLENHFKDDSGNLWKCLYPANLTYRGDDPQKYHPYFDEERPYELKTNRENYDYTQLARFIDIINNTATHQLEDSIESILHVSEYLKYQAVNILTGSWDDYWALMNNYYIYHEPSSGKFHWIPYDYDNTFGISWAAVDWTSASPYDFPKVVSGERPLAERVLDRPRYHNLYTHFLEHYREHVFDLQLWEDRLDRLKNRIAPFVRDDVYYTIQYGFTMDDFYASYGSQHYENQHVHRGIKEFVNLRNHHLDQQLQYVHSKPIVYDLQCSPRHPLPGDSIQVHAAVFSPVGLKEVKLVFEEGDDDIHLKHKPRTPETMVENADHWQGTIPPLGPASVAEFTLQATDSENKTAAHPLSGTIVLNTPDINADGLVINEFLAINDHINQDSNGEYEDWLELYNGSDETLDLNGYYLSDDPEWLTRWRFPEQTIELAPGEWLLIWCDDDPDQEGWHTNFKLDGDGEFIGLVAPDGYTIIDSIFFGEQNPDTAYGRVPDGGSSWQWATPTPAEGNQPVTIRKNPPQRPVSFSLNVYPNPFNAGVTVEYQLPEAGEVSTSVYNAIGQQVWKSGPHYRNRGHHRWRWQAEDKNGSSLSSGVYFLHLQFGEQHHYRKLLLLR